MILRLLLAALFFSSAFAEEAKEEVKKPVCKHVDPYKNLKDWLSYTNEGCNHTSVVDSLSAEEKARYDYGIKGFAFDMLASDKLGPSRELPKVAHELCEKTEFKSTLSTSIVIIYHNEALSVLIRMLNSILARTPKELLKEIILYDDASEVDYIISHLLKDFAKAKGVESLLRIEGTDERQGLIRAKVLASRLVTGDVMVVLDSHCEVSENWLPPLLAPIEEDEKTVVLPVVDLINPVTFEYSNAMIAKGGFDWGLTFKWTYLPWSYFNVEENNVKPFPSPAMSGGLLAIRTDWFRKLGEYDMGMEIWGAENMELSLKTWLCGGRLLIAPCSRVGHVFRMRRPYKTKPGMDTALRNAARVARVWFGDYEKYFLRSKPSSSRQDLGDVSEQIKLKESLQCKDMAWFIDNVYPELRPADDRREDL